MLNTIKDILNKDTIEIYTQKIPERDRVYDALSECRFVHSYEVEFGIEGLYNQSRFTIETYKFASNHVKKHLINAIHNKL